MSEAAAVAAHETVSPNGAVSDPGRALRHRTSALLNGGLDPDEAVRIDTERGNHDLLQLIRLLRLEGPLRPTNPWELQDARGTHLINAGSYAALPFGEAYPPMVEFVQRFLATPPSTVGFAQQSASAWRGALNDTLIGILSEHAPSHVDSRVFLSNSGAEAIETALKFVRAARPKATTIVNFKRGYHGKTLGALSLTPNEEYQLPFRPLLGPIRTLPYGDLDALTSAVREIGPDKVQAILVEPVQGEAGVISPPPGFLSGLGELAREHGILVIADEIQSGLGRTGHWFASVADGLDPDIITLAKPLGGGMVPIGAVIARRAIYSAMLKGVKSKLHSNTFGGGALACAVALRSLELIHDEGLVAKARVDGAYGLERLRAIRDTYPQLIGEVRAVGMLFAITIKPVLPGKLLPIDPALVPQLSAFLGIAALHRAGVHACYSENAEGIVRFTPPLNVPLPTLATLFDRLEAMAAQHKSPMNLLRLLSAGEMARLVRLAF